VDSLDRVIIEETDSESVRIAGVDEVQGQYSGLVRLEARSLSNDLGSEFTWYKATSDSLVEVAYLNAGRVSNILPKNSVPLAISPFTIPSSLWRFAIKKMVADSVQIRNDLRVVHCYPLSVGTKWISFRDPFYSEREVVGTGFITVRAGTFYCAKIKTTIDLGGGMLDMEWFDYVAPEGLILRTVYFARVAIGDETDPIETHFGSVTERMEMISVSSL
jgi:hypothetical protein